MGTDGPKTSFRAAEEAAEIAKEEGSTLLIVSVYRQPDPHTSAPARVRRGPRQRGAAR